MNSELRNRIAADIFVNSIKDLKMEYIYSQTREDAAQEGKEVGTYLAEQAIEMADGFMKVLNEQDNKRING